MPLASVRAIEVSVWTKHILDFSASVRAVPLLSGETLPYALSGYCYRVLELTKAYDDKKKKSRTNF